jgi:hypothetical protein
MARSKFRITTRCKLWCPECRELRQVVAVNGSVRLTCGHTRKKLLPSKTDCLSVEALAAARTAEEKKLIAQLFPHSRTRELTTQRQWIDWGGKEN